MDDVPNSRIVGALGAGILVSLLLGWSPAFAHAALVDTNPAAGATIQKLPTEATATLSENVGTPAYVVVAAPNGEKATVGKPTVRNQTVSIKLKDLDIRGKYTLSYRVVSADGHPVKGTISFTVEEGRTVKASADAPADESFIHEHKNHLLWGAGGVAVAIALLLWPSRRKSD